MMKIVKRAIAILALWAGILGLLLGFGLWFYPGTTAFHGPALSLCIIAMGLIAWWLGCRLAIVVPRRVRQDQTGPQPLSGQVHAPDPHGVVLHDEVLDLAGAAHFDELAAMRVEK